MSTRSPDGTDRLPTTGPDTECYDRLQSVTANGDLIVYDTEREEAWIQATSAVDLEEWR